MGLVIGTCLSIGFELYNMLKVRKIKGIKNRNAMIAYNYLSSR